MDLPLDLSIAPVLLYCRGDSFIVAFDSGDEALQFGDFRCCASFSSKFSTHRNHGPETPVGIVALAARASRLVDGSR